VFAVRRGLLAYVAFALASCAAPWHAVVKYSDQQAPIAQPLADGVYSATLQEVLLQRGWPKVAVLDTVPLLLPVDPGPSVIRSHWPDSLKRQVRAATKQLRHHQRYQDALPLGHLRQLAASLGIDLRPPSDSAAILFDGRDSLPVPHLSLSMPGFNADSTLAAIEVSYWCGELCAHGATLLLARRPGYRWRVWQYHVHWVS
jgi:hypothetical protein